MSEQAEEYAIKVPYGRVAGLSYSRDQIAEAFDDGRKKGYAAAQADLRSVMACGHVKACLIEYMETVAEFDGEGNPYPVPIPAQMCTACESERKLREAAKEIYNCIEAGLLVRDTSRDHVEGWTLRQIPLVRALGILKAALDPQASTEEGTGV